MAATRFGLYNDALDIIGERRLVTITDDEKSRYDLDSAWDASGTTAGGIIYCLEMSLWNFATRSTSLEYSPSVEPPFGFLRAFDKPTDWLRTAAVCTDPYYKNPLDDTGYADEAGFFFADLDVIYVKYISQDAEYGLDMSRWSQAFSAFVTLYLAQTVVMSITQNMSKVEAIEKKWQKALHAAAGIDGTNKPTATRPIGMWAGARFGGRSRMGGGNWEC